LESQGGGKTGGGGIRQLELNVQEGKSCPVDGEFIQEGAKEVLANEKTSAKGGRKGKPFKVGRRGGYNGPKTKKRSHAGRKPEQEEVSPDNMEKRCGPERIWNERNKFREGSGGSFCDAQFKGVGGGRSGTTIARGKRLNWQTDVLDWSGYA